MIGLKTSFSMKKLVSFAPCTRSLQRDQQTNILISVCKKTLVFFFFDKKTSRTRLAKFLKTRSLLIVNDCFKNKHNAVFGVFLQRLITSQYFGIQFQRFFMSCLSAGCIAHIKISIAQIHISSCILRIQFYAFLKMF